LKSIALASLPLVCEINHLFLTSMSINQSPDFRERLQQRIAAAKLAAQTHQDLNAWAYLDWAGASAAVDSAATADSPVTGLLVGVKDLFNVEGMPTHAGTKAALPALGTGESPLVADLKRGGAIILGKTNMHEIALGATGENLHTGDVKNPIDPARQSGGSSSGSAVAVATGQCDVALGSDTGGSVRIPAAFCGIVGFKPSYGVLSLEGALYLSKTCDHAGILASTVKQCATVFQYLASPKAAGALGRKPKFAVPDDWLSGRLSEGVRDVFNGVLGKLSTLLEVDSVPTPNLHRAWECHTPIVRAEGAHVHKSVLLDPEAPGHGFSAMVLPALQAGLQVSAQDYLAAREVRAEVRAELDRLLSDYDALILPTSPVVAPLRGQTEVEVEGGIMTVREAVLGQTLPFSMCGLPTISIPMGMLAGLPVGLQIVCARGNDSMLLAFADWLALRAE
jgi:aspartyl-tRNA(Asn)/glutamyl-tRNA(Gln) amidotransferase subunit A